MSSQAKLMAEMAERPPANLTKFTVLMLRITARHSGAKDKCLRCTTLLHTGVTDRQYEDQGRFLAQVLLCVFLLQKPK